jgi:hypothetical protein
VFKYIDKNQKGVVHIGTRLWVGKQRDRGFGSLHDSPQRQKIFSSQINFKLLLRPTQSPSQSVTRTLSQGVKRPGREFISV